MLDQSLRFKCVLKVKRLLKRFFSFQTMLSYVLSSIVTAVEKDNAVLVIQELVSLNLCENVDVTALLDELVKVFNLKKPPARCK